MIKNVMLLCFSPTGGTKSIGSEVCSGLGKATQLIDLSSRYQIGAEFAPTDVVVAAVPVFGGRVPAPAAAALRTYSAEGTPAVAVAVYGNRNYDDALVELEDILKECGFNVIAGGAFVSKHTLVDDIAADRPTALDLAEAKAFGKLVNEKIESGDPASVELPGNRPYKESAGLPAVPTASDACIECGECVRPCPTKAIPADEPGTTNAERCIQCMRCVALCPQHARALPAEARAMIGEMLHKVAVEPRKNETYL